MAEKSLHHIATVGKSGRGKQCFEMIGRGSGNGASELMMVWSFLHTVGVQAVASASLFLTAQRGVHRLDICIVACGREVGGAQNMPSVTGSSAIDREAILV